jgi:RNA polymerase sigma-70 factor (ECF subfamily)
VGRGPISEHQDSGELLRRVRRGSVEALGELYRAHADSVYTLALRLTGSRADAEDVLHDVFLGLARAAASYHEHGRFAAWLGRIAARAALMRMRARRRKRESPLEEAGSAAVTHGADPVDRIALEQALARLPAPLRVVFVLKEIEGYSHEEIGGMLGITAANSAQRLSRAWKQLRREMTR